MGYFPKFLEVITVSCPKDSIPAFWFIQSFCSLFSSIFLEWQEVEIDIDTIPELLSSILNGNYFLSILNSNELFYLTTTIEVIRFVTKAENDTDININI